VPTREIDPRSPDLFESHTQYVITHCIPLG
jgi:hypothetical protein